MISTPKKTAQQAHFDKIRQKVKLMGIINHAFNFKRLDQIQDYAQTKLVRGERELFDFQRGDHFARGYREQGDAALYTDENAA
eukprot:g7605.t1